MRFEATPNLESITSLARPPGEEDGPEEPTAEPLPEPLLLLPLLTDSEEPLVTADRKAKIKAMTIPAGINCAAVATWLTAPDISFHLIVNSMAAMRAHATVRPPKVSTSFRTRAGVRLQMSARTHFLVA